MSFIAVIGASGSGKTTIINTLIKMFPGLYLRAKSYTTRLKRAGEGNEYEFISEEQMQKLLDTQKILYIDEAYGNKYAMDAEVFSPQTKDIIKEIHPKNVKKIRKYCPDLIIVAIKCNGCFNRIGRAEDYNVTDFHADITFINDINAVAELSIINLSRQIQAAKTHNELGLPSIDIIDSTNKRGYDSIANEFYDDKRLTTANFHDASKSFFTEELGSYKGDESLLEIGSGNGWLNTLSCFEIPSIDISENMNAGSYQSHIGIRQLVCDYDKYDAIFASLCDPYFYPNAIASMLQILKKDGRLIVSLPSYEWCKLNRNGSMKTKFVSSDGTSYEVYSFTYTKAQIENIGKKLGFVIDKYKKCSLGIDYQYEISNEIIKPANKNGLDARKICIVECYVIKKEY